MAAPAPSPPNTHSDINADEVLLKELLDDDESDASLEVLDLLERCLRQGRGGGPVQPALFVALSEVSDPCRLRLCQALLSSRFPAALGQQETGIMLAALLLPRCLSLGVGSAPRPLSSALAAAAEAAPLAAAAAVAGPLLLATDKNGGGEAVASRVELVIRALSAQPGQQFSLALLDRLCEGSCGEAAVAVISWMLEASAGTPPHISMGDLTLAQAQLLAGMCEGAASVRGGCLKFGKLLLTLVRAGLGGPPGRDALRRAVAATNTLLTVSTLQLLDIT